MRVLLNECVPRKLNIEISNHEVSTVTENGWSGLKNGELLALAEVEFDVFPHNRSKSEIPTVPK